MASDTVHVGQLICDSTTPPPDRGFYKINDTTTGHVGNLVMSDPVSGKESVALTATLSGGVIAFDAKIAAAIGKAAAQNALADPYYDARPPSLVPVNTLTMRAYCSDGVYLYGNGTDASAVYRQRESDAAPTKMFTWPATHAVYSVYAELGVIFAIIRETGTSLYTLWRSTDSAASFSECLKIGVGSDGIHYPGTFPFIRGLCSGRLSDGREAVICTTYNVDLVEDVVLPKDRRYAVISYDRGNSWSVLWELNVGSKHTRHFHAAKIDAQGRVIIMLGDTDLENATVVAHDILRWPFPNNVTPAQLQSYPGFSVATGQQNDRAVDGVIIGDSPAQKIITYTDTSSEGLGGIWLRDYPSLSNKTRVAHPNAGQTHDGWLFVRHENGSMYACDATLSGPNIYYNITGSRDGLHWFPVGRYYVAANSTPVSMFVTPSGNIAIAAQNGAGPLYAICTHVYRLGDKALDDDIENILAPVIWVRSIGNDTATGATPQTALKTVQAAFIGGKSPSKCRIVVQGDDGPGSVVKITQARWGATTPIVTNNTADTSVYWHVSGDGADKTELEISGSGAVFGTNASGWVYRFDALKICRSSTPDNLLLCDNFPQTGATKYIFTDVVIGDPVRYATHLLYVYTATTISRRSTFRSVPNDNAKYTVYLREASVSDFQSCVFEGGRVLQRNGATVSILQSVFDKTTGYIIDASSTVAPKLKNNFFGEGTTTASIVNGPLLDLTASVTGNYFPALNGTAGIPAQALAVGSAAMVGSGYRPIAGSPLIGAAVSTGVKHDFYRKPFLSTPSVGAVEGAF